MATGRLHYCAKAKPTHCKNVGVVAKMDGNGTEMTGNCINNATDDKSANSGCVTTGADKGNHDIGGINFGLKVPRSVGPF